METKQVLFIDFLKGELSDQGFDSVLEYTEGIDVSKSNSFEVYIISDKDNNNNVDARNRADAIEESFYYVILCIKKNMINKNNIEKVKRSQTQKIKSALFNSINNNEIIKWGNIHTISKGGIPDFIKNTFQDKNYIMFIEYFSITVSNSY